VAAEVAIMTPKMLYPVDTRGPRNQYDVPLRRWRRWSKVARGVFNETYRVLTVGWNVVAPESMRAVRAKSRRVLAWNTAWCAADAANGEA